MKINNKIIQLKDISKIDEINHRKKIKIVHCHGVFDLLHIGHIKHFKLAKKMGDILIVSITADEYVRKGLNRPFFNQDMRSEALASLNCVDYVVIVSSESAVSAIKKIKPNIYCKGNDYKKLNNDLTGKIYSEKVAVESFGGKIVFTNDITFSSSSLLNESFDIFDEDQKLFIKKIKSKFNFNEIKKMILKSKRTNTLIIGEAIIDEYTFCEVIGKSGKEPVLAFRDINTERYAGGSLAIAKNLSSFCNYVNLVSMIGEKKEHYNFILKNLPKNVKSFFLNKHNSPTILKKRYIDRNNNNKLLGIYKLNDSDLIKTDQTKLLKKIISLINKIDMVIISDFGHGLLNSDVVKKIFNQNIYKSVNAQINSSNIGFHSLNKYRNSDIIVINETELRHEMKDREGKLDYLIKKLSHLIKAKYLVVTSGKSGVKLYDSKNNVFHHCPAFANKVIDKVGAGDTLLAVISILLYNKCDIDVSLFVASVCAAESVESIGNSNTINLNYTLKRIEHMLK